MTFQSNRAADEMLHRPAAADVENIVSPTYSPTMNSAAASSSIERPAYFPAVLVEGATFTLASMSLTGAGSYWLLGTGLGWPQALASLAIGAVLTYAFRHDIKRA